MRILISGATGFIGKKIGFQLFQAGHEIIAIVRNPKRAKSELPFPAEIISWDENSIENVDAILHLAGESVAGKRWSKKRKQELVDSRIQTTQKILSLAKNCKGRKPHTFVGASAIGFYGDRGDEWLTEGSKPGNSFLADLCQSWEKEVFKARELSMRTLAIRIGIVLGRDGGALAEMLPIFKLGLGAALGSGKQWMSWIHAADLVNMLQHGLENEAANGVWNGVAPMPVTNKDFSRTLSTLLGTRLLPSLPGFIFKVALGEMSAIILASQRVKSEQSLKYNFKYSFPSLNAALADILTGVELTHGIYAELYDVQQWVPKEAAVVFPFFSDAKNLEKITPHFLHFKILEQSTEKISQGTTFRYRLKIHGLPIFWRTKILAWDENKSFIDNQESGPYSLWRHTHNFLEIKNGTLMGDHVVYRLPLGWLGYAFGHRFVRKDIQNIFAYRRQVVSDIYT